MGFHALKDGCFRAEVQGMYLPWSHPTPGNDNALWSQRTPLSWKARSRNAKPL